MPDLEHEGALGPRVTPATTRVRPLARGDLVGRYVVLEPLGAGGMGEVFAAYDPQLDRKVAVKLLLPSRSSAAGSSRLLREAQAMAKLDHPNVVSVHDVGTHGERVFVAMEFVEGGTLADWMASGSDGQGTPHPWRAVLERFDAAGRGLAAAHAAGLVHRDFKPANVLVGRDGQVRVADFGLVRRALDDPRESASASGSHVAAMSTSEAEATLVLDGSEPLDDDTHARPSSHALDPLALRMTRTGTTLGTPGYMAPEQYRGSTVDARADQFSFCVALWEALHGQRPFGGPDLATLMAAIDRGLVREPPSEREVPAAIRRALVRGLARDPAQRWPDMDALLGALRDDPSLRRRRWALAGLGAGLLGLVIGVVAQPEPPPPEPPPPPCRDAAAAFGDAFGHARRGAIERRFATFETLWVRDVGARLVPRLDAWASEWQREWTDACEDTRVRGEQSEALLDRRMVCLERRRHSFVGLVDALAEADAALAKKADLLVDDLGDVAACGDVEALLRITPLPDDPATLDTIFRIETTLEAANRLYRAGEFAEARALLEPQRPLVAKLGYAPLEAAFDRVDGNLALVTDGRKGEALLEHAFTTALEHGDDGVAIDVARSLASALNELDRPKDALRWLDIATALVRRNGGSPRHLAELALIRSQTLGWLGDLEGSESSARESYRLFMASDSESSRIGDALYLLGVADHRAGRIAAALDHIEQARRAWGGSIGPRHPRNSSALTMLGILSRRLGRYDDARRHFEEVLAIKLATYGPDHREVSTARANLSVAYGDLGRLDEAIALLEQVLADRGASPTTSKADLGRAYVNIAQLQQIDGRISDAQTSIRRGEALLREQLDPDHPDLVTAYRVHAEIELARAQPAAAARLIDAALHIAEQKFEDASGLSELHTVAARIALARNQASEADRLIALALAVEDADPFTRAQRDAVHARTLVALGRCGEGLERAQATRTSLVALGPRASRELAQLDAWLPDACPDRAPARDRDP